MFLFFIEVTIVKYSELNQKAQKIARHEYQKGHPEEEFSDEDLHYMCLDSDDILDYFEDGTIMGDDSHEQK